MCWLFLDFELVVIINSNKFLFLLVNVKIEFKIIVIKKFINNYFIFIYEKKFLKFKFKYFKLFDKLLWKKLN